MKTIVSSLLALSVLAGAGAGATASAADKDCKVKGWTDGGQGGRPIFECPDKS